MQVPLLRGCCYASVPATEMTTGIMFSGRPILRIFQNIPGGNLFKFDTIMHLDSRMS